MDGIVPPLWLSRIFIPVYESVQTSKCNLHPTSVMAIFFQVEQILTKKRWIDLTGLLDRLGTAVIRKQLDLFTIGAQNPFSNSCCFVIDEESHKPI
jgi:hypothetical protein